MKYLKTLFYKDDPGFIPHFRAILTEYKVVHLKNVPPDTDLMNFYTNFIQSSGQLIRRGEDFKDKKFVPDQWLDVRYDPNQANTYRHSNTPQPLHTDGAYIVDFDFEIVFLFCTQRATHGGATTFIDANFLYELLKLYNPDLLELLKKEVVAFSKGTFGAKNSKIIDRDEKGFLINWNQYRISESNSPEVKEMANRFRNFLQDRVWASGLLTPVLLEKGEAVFFHDQRVLHARNAFFGDRCLIKGAMNF